MILNDFEVKWTVVSACAAQNAFLSVSSQPSGVVAAPATLRGTSAAGAQQGDLGPGIRSDWTSLNLDLVKTCKNLNSTQLNLREIEMERAGKTF